MEKVNLKLGDCVHFRLSNGKYSGAIISKALNYRGYHNFFFLITNIYKDQAPHFEDFLSAQTFGREKNNYLDDVLIINERFMVNFAGRFEVAANIQLNSEVYRFGAYRHQQTFPEFERSVLHFPKIDYTERKPYPIRFLIK
ncbi:MAG: hypothetical protein NW226_18170 [Microscillaceae bacterium]|nr:hypothetical protein [Microscillaceae bacterium]